jgi:hypothetical protein
MHPKTKLQLLSNFIEKRNHRRGTVANLEMIRYAEKSITDKIKFPVKNVLYVGIGHGLDAILNILDQKYENVYGVDPFIETDGNGDEDYGALLDLIRSLDLNNNISIFRETIQDFLLKNNSIKFDLVIFKDSLHHIFVTKDSLNRSDLKVNYDNLVEKLHSLINVDGNVLIVEVSRFNLRRVAKKLGLYKTIMDYDTKQQPRQWIEPYLNLGWQVHSFNDYIPYKLRFLNKYKKLSKIFFPRYSFGEVYSVLLKKR